MNNDLKPGKGAHLVVNAEMLAFMQGTLYVLEQAYDEVGGDTAADQSGKDVFNQMHELVKTNSLQAGSIDDFLEQAGDVGINYAKDSFGEKLIFSTEYPDGECRVTLVLTKKGELKLDIRPWIEY